MLTLFPHSTAPPSTIVSIAICTLPEELTPGWDKLPLGKQMVTNVARLLECGNRWQCKFHFYVSDSSANSGLGNVPGLHAGPATLSMTCRACDVLVSSMLLHFSLQVIQCVLQITPDGHDCVAALEEYHSGLFASGQEFKNVSCVSTQIEVGLAWLDFCPLGHADHIAILKSLAYSFSSRYDQEGNISDLNTDIEISQTILDFCPLDHPEHANALGGLAISLWKYYRIQKNQADLNRLIEMEQRWLDLCPSSHSDHARALGALATSLWERYDIWEDVTDLNKSIEMGEKLIDLWPLGHQQHTTALTNLAVSLAARYHRQDNLTDLDRAIDLDEKSLELQLPGHQHDGIVLLNLAVLLQRRYNKVKNHSDLIRSIKLFKEALAIYPVQHHYFASIVAHLAATILLPFNSSQSCHPPDQPLPVLDEAFEIYRQLKRCGTGSSLDLWKATQDWVKDAEKHNHSSVLEAYQTSLSTLDHFTSFNSSLDSRHETMQTKVADLANNAFSCATRHGNFQMAVELLEQGRGILWNQLARFDISITALEGRGSQGRELGREFTLLSADLRKHAEGSGDKGLAPYWRVQEEWQSVVDKIRRLDGFSRFLLPPRFEDLQQAAERGPVVIVNASEYACDAVIVLRTGPPVHVPLPCSLDDVIEICSRLSELTKDPHAYGDNRESWLKQMLRELWSSVVKPIVAVLQNDVQLPPGSRIWWCPTSNFTSLPFHAAGPHRKLEKNLMDLYVSSYAPSLSALIRAPNRDRYHGKARAVSGRANVISFAAVGQARPSTNAKLSELPEVEREIQKIRNETNMPSDVKFEIVTGNAATVEGAVQAFRDHRWVHLACHGAQHATRPFESWFAMGDGKLTLMRIIQERYTNSEFAFLSACHTAVGDGSTPDEVLHLAAGLQFAGFNGVIGTLWKVDDAVAHQVVTRFYKEMFKRPVIDFEHAAAALNTAVVESAGEVTLEKRIVFVHIGI